MNRVKLYRFLFLTLAIAFFSCKKEYSLENVRLQGNAIYSLQDSVGNCTTADIHGTFRADSTLSDSSYVNIHVNFTTTGKYYFTSDTINGMWFLDSGYALVTGPTVIKLKGFGQPILPTISNFLINNNSHGCGFTIKADAGDDYLPRTEASTWKYGLDPSLLDNNGLPISSFSVTVTSPLISYNGRDYYQYFSTELKDTYYFAKDGDNYWAHSTLDFDYTYVFDSPNPFTDYIYLKTNQPINTSWESVPVTVTYGAAWGLTPKTGLAKDIFTIVNISPTYSVGGNIFQNVITVKRELMFQATGTTSYVKLMDGLAMYAKGVGLVNQEISLPGGLIQKIPLLSWTIK